MSDLTANRSIFGWARLLLIGLGLLVLIAIAVGLLLRGYYSGQAEASRQAAIAALDASDPGWRWDDLIEMRATVADADNAAFVALKTTELLPEGFLAEFKNADGKTVRVNEALWRAPLNQPLPDELQSFLRPGLEDAQPALELARTLVDKPNGRYPMEWTEDIVATILPWQRARDVSRLLCLSALFLAEDGKMQQACASIRAALNVGRSLGDEPTFLSQLVRIAMVSQALQALERVMARGHCSDECLRTLQAAIEQELADRTRVMSLATRGERAVLFRTWSLVIDGKRTLDELNNGNKPGVWQRLRNELVFRPLAGSAQRTTLDLTTRLVEISAEPVQEQQRLLEDLESEMQDRLRQNGLGDRLALSLLPALSRILLADHRLRMELEVARCALAAERYRRGNGQWPDKLEELAPDYVSETPKDLFAGQPLTYRKLEEGIVIYSHGMDGKDHDGAVEPGRPDISDIAFRLFNPDK